MWCKRLAHQSKGMDQSFFFSISLIAQSAWVRTASNGDCAQLLSTGRSFPSPRFPLSRAAWARMRWGRATFRPICSARRLVWRVNAASSSVRNPSRGSGRVTCSALEGCIGQTRWQMSHPSSRIPMRLRKDSGTGMPSIIKLRIHRSGWLMPSLSSAPEGQASTQRLQFRQENAGGVRSVWWHSMSVAIKMITTYVPYCGVSNRPLLRMVPRPARTAASRAGYDTLARAKQPARTSACPSDCAAWYAALEAQ